MSYVHLYSHPELYYHTSGLNEKGRVVLCSWWSRYRFSTQQRRKVHGVPEPREIDYNPSGESQMSGKKKRAIIKERRRKRYANVDRRKIETDVRNMSPSPIVYKSYDTEKEFAVPFSARVVTGKTRRCWKENKYVYLEKVRHREWREIRDPDDCGEDFLRKYEEKKERADKRLAEILFGAISNSGNKELFDSILGYAHETTRTYNIHEAFPIHSLSELGISQYDIIEDEFAAVDESSDEESSSLSESCESDDSTDDEEDRIDPDEYQRILNLYNLMEESSSDSEEDYLYDFPDTDGEDNFFEFEIDQDVLLSIMEEYPEYENSDGYFEIDIPVEMMKQIYLTSVPACDDIFISQTKPVEDDIFLNSKPFVQPESNGTFAIPEEKAVRKITLEEPISVSVVDRRYGTTRFIDGPGTFYLNENEEVLNFKPTQLVK
eukprot:TRINITY_DN12127_c0_g1_i1.p1 TRINITY_DN12127_c0_g1~~TRINITY_DN12127_c0_g1_i1.p1  ORF type:complete len:434 (-),score=131.05 TRINITY_DN12127_c0_g1_i1:33-1334(-)